MDRARQVGMSKGKKGLSRIATTLSPAEDSASNVRRVPFCHSSNEDVESAGTLALLSQVNGRVAQNHQ